MRVARDGSNRLMDLALNSVDHTSSRRHVAVGPRDSSTARRRWSGGTSGPQWKSGASLARSPQSARKTLVNAARPGRIYFSECLVRDTAGPKSGTATSRAGGLLTGGRRGGRGRQKATSVTVRQAKRGERAETTRLGLQSKPAERRRSSVTPGLGPVYTRPKRGRFPGYSRTFLG